MLMPKDQIVYSFWVGARTRATIMSDIAGARPDPGFMPQYSGAYL